MEILDNAEGVKIGSITSRNNGDAAIAVLTNRILNKERNGTVVQMCVDVGAAQGWWTVLAARHGFHVLSFEPDSVGYKELTKNVHDGGLDQQVNCINAAISNVDASQTLRINGEQSFIEGLREMSQDKDANPDWPTVDVETMRLDSVLCASAMKDVVVPLMKVDTEGHELSVFSAVHGSIGRINNIVTEFSVYWYGVDKDAAVNAGVTLMKQLSETHTYIYMLSRVGSVYYIGPISPDKFESFCEALYSKHLQVDLAFMRYEIPTEWGLTVFKLDETNLLDTR